MALVFAIMDMLCSAAIAGISQTVITIQLAIQWENEAMSKFQKLVKRAAWEFVEDSELKGKVGSIAVHGLHHPNKRRRIDVIAIVFYASKTRPGDPLLKMAFMGYASCLSF